MRGVLVGVGLLVAALTSLPPVSAQPSPCVASTWTDAPGSGSVVRPGPTPYEAHVSVYSNAGCPQAATCPGSGPTVAFSLRTVNKFAGVSFHPNPSNVTGGNGPVDGRSTTTVFSMLLQDAAPFNQSFTVTIRATCGGSTFDITHGFKVGSNPIVDARIVNSTPDAHLYSWTLSVSNRGNRDLRVELNPSIEPVPAQEQRWTLPPPLVLRTGAAPGSQANLTVSLADPPPRAKLALKVVARIVDPLPGEAAPEVPVSLPFAAFPGSATPSVDGGMGLLAVAGALSLRRFR